jgi:hypothetical protein
MHENVDYEAISDALGVEINAELSPARIHRILKHRIDSMSALEVSAVEGQVWQQIRLLDAKGDLMHRTKTPVGLEAHHEWVNVVALPPRSFLLLPLTDTEGFSDLLVSKPLFTKWVTSNNIQVVKEQDGVMIMGDHLAGLSETFVSKVIASF